MGERGEGSVEMGHEHIPSSEEVQALFVELAEGKEYVVAKKLEDEKGLFLWNIEIPTEDGGIKEFSYMRKGRYPNVGQAAETAIHVTNFDSDGMPGSGNSVMKCNDQGVWRKTP